MGLSPSERGDQAAIDYLGDQIRPIPEGAGRPVKTFRGSGPNRAYPRASGATLELPDPEYAIFGLSPSERGDP